MISEFQSGEKIVDFFVLRHKEMRTKRDSSENYLSLELGDASGRVFGSLWNDVAAANNSLQEGQIVKVRAAVIDWHGKLHLSIDKIRGAQKTDDVKLERFLPASKISAKVLLEKIQSFMDKVDDPYLHQLLVAVYENRKLQKKIQQAPGGKLWHHCYTGGLLEHTLSVAKLCLNIAENYDDINSSLLISGALLHDIGKIVEFNTNAFFDYSDEGRLHGHIAVGFHQVASLIEKIPNFPDETKKQLLHLILSHQGAKEHGSPVVPMTREAFVLNCADELDAKMGAFDRIQNREIEPGKKWSNYVNLMDRFLYFGADNA